ncbi:MAG: AAA family ATPase [Muribaculaceae bacterium]|nr:AAA family ATPase [Muribaculaceae bacterium]
MAFRKAERKQVKLKIGISAPSGAGKTYSALLIAKGICGDLEKVAVIDTENGSAELYSNLGEYSVCPIAPPFTPSKYIEAIHEAEQAGFSVLIIDSLSHAWTGEGGLLDMQDKAVKASKSGNSYTAWREITPEHNRLVDAILQSPMDIIVTTRAKAEYAVTDDNGKKGYKKIGLAPIFRDGLEYELTVFFDMTQEHVATASKDRTKLFDGKSFVPSEDTGKMLDEWRKSGAECKCAICGKPMEFSLYGKTIRAYGAAICSKECKEDYMLEPDKYGGNTDKPF